MKNLRIEARILLARYKHWLTGMLVGLFILYQPSFAVDFLRPLPLAEKKAESVTFDFDHLWTHGYLEIDIMGNHFLFTMRRYDKSKRIGRVALEVFNISNTDGRPLVKLGGYLDIIINPNGSANMWGSVYFENMNAEVSDLIFTSQTLSYFEKSGIPLESINQTLTYENRRFDNNPNAAVSINKEYRSKTYLAHLLFASAVETALKEGATKFNIKEVTSLEAWRLFMRFIRPERRLDAVCGFGDSLSFRIPADINPTPSETGGFEIIHNQSGSVQFVARNFGVLSVRPVPVGLLDFSNARAAFAETSV